MRTQTTSVAESTEDSPDYRLLHSSLVYQSLPSVLLLLCNSSNTEGWDWCVRLAALSELTCTQHPQLRDSGGVDTIQCMDLRLQNIH